MAETAETFFESGRNIVRGVVDNPALSASSEDAHLRESLRQAADIVAKAMDMSSNAVDKAVTAASDKAFENAANIGSNLSYSAAESTFSWSGYFQAIGILCVLLAALWFGTWLIRRYGKFNFLPRPGALPKDALMMEAQMPLGPKKGLMVVRFFDKRLLLGITEHQITLLSEDKAQNVQNNFQNLLDSHKRTDSGHIAD